MSAPAFNLIISGPTASGKTALSLRIAERLPLHIINADVGQLYAPLSVGTAKPDVHAQPVPHHCFDLAQEPTNISVPQWQAHVARAQETAGAHDAISAIVGGSLFYIKSLYFPIHAQSLPTVQWQDMPDCTNQELWNQLHDIDPTRARAIHINDRYRLVRALNVWQQTGTAPSSFEPMFAPQFQSLFIFLAPPSEQLRENIAVRTSHMLASGWIEETKQLLDTPWEPFLLKKGLIGYPAIIEWLRDGARQASFAALHERIVTDTWQYARRQIIFWRSLERSLTKNKNNSPFGCTVLSLSAVHDATVDHIVQMLENLRKG